MLPFNLENPFPVPEFDPLRHIAQQAVRPTTTRQPCRGLSMRRTKDGHAVIRVHYSADPTMVDPLTGRPTLKLELERRKYTRPGYWAREMEIEYEALEGQRVFPEFDHNIHVIPHEKIPSRLCCYMAIDPHPRTPHAFLWVGLDRTEWYVYREYWPSVIYAQPGHLKDYDVENSFTVKQYVTKIAQLEGNEIKLNYEGIVQDEYGVYKQRDKGSSEYILDRYMDQAGKGFRASAENEKPESYAERYNRYGVICNDPYKIREAGYDAVRDLLKVRHHDGHERGWPTLHISDRCPELRLELAKYRYMTSQRFNEERELKQQGVESRCHLIDLLRYLTTAPGVRFSPGSESNVHHHA